MSHVPPVNVYRIPPSPNEQSIRICVCRSQKMQESVSRVERGSHLSTVATLYIGSARGADLRVETSNMMGGQSASPKLHAHSPREEATHRCISGMGEGHVPLVRRKYSGRRGGSVAPPWLRCLAFACSCVVVLWTGHALFFSRPANRCSLLTYDAATTTELCAAHPRTSLRAPPTKRATSPLECEAGARLSLHAKTGI